MYTDATRRSALAVLRSSASVSEASRVTGISRQTLRQWRDQPRRTRHECPRCEEAPLDVVAYSALLGFYLGDGHVSQMARYSALRVSCDNEHPRIIEDVEGLMLAVHPDRPAFRVRAPGCTVVSVDPG